MHISYAEPATEDDAATILAMVVAHEGETSAEIAQHWLQVQPQAFTVYRNLDGDLIGFMAHVSLQLATQEDIDIDPAVARALRFVERYGPVMAGQEVIHLRFWMSRDDYQAPSPALNLTAIKSASYWTTHRHLAWNFIATANPGFLQPHFSALNMRRSPEADFDVGGRRYGVFSHDWRVEPVSAWLQMKSERYPHTDLTLADVEATLPPPLLVLSQPEFEEAVRQALRNYTRPDRLAANPLMKSRLVVEESRKSQTPASLQSLLRKAAATLTSNPRDKKLYRAILYTYLEPTTTQEKAAEQLDLPFSTYRYHLAKGVERLTDWLWQQELYGVDN